MVLAFIYLISAMKSSGKNFWQSMNYTYDNFSKNFRAKMEVERRFGVVFFTAMQDLYSPVTFLIKTHSVLNLFENK